MDEQNNFQIGREFEDKVKEYFRKEKGMKIRKNKIEIGNPQKEYKKQHEFDIVGVIGKKKVAIECKRYIWTKTGKVPSAKMGHINEAAFYLSFLTDEYEKYIVLFYAECEKREETLAEYYYGMNKHLLGDIKVVEFDTKNEPLELEYVDKKIIRKKIEI